jgi:hypothetical protein
VNKTVPTADVVIVNPEHYAVALKYDSGRAEAPFVVAKGVDEMALYIKRGRREAQDRDRRAAAAGARDLQHQPGAAADSGPAVPGRVAGAELRAATECIP